MNNDKFAGKYRIPSARASWWNYGDCAAYFVTICTAEREHFFGEISDQTMNLNAIGKIAVSEWLKTAEIRPDMNLRLEEFVVMPNHFHAIIIIGNNGYNRSDLSPSHNSYGPQTKNLASILRGFKSSVTSKALAIDVRFGWQTRFYDHIIRDDDEYRRIAHYIENNPTCWKDDKFYAE